MKATPSRLIAAALSILSLFIIATSLIGSVRTLTHRAGAAGRTDRAPLEAEARLRLQRAYGQLPLAFEENRG